jgi:leucine dehydrogenase
MTAATATPTAVPEGSVGPVAFDHEELIVQRGARSGLDAAVAIHSTALGPTLGGVRLWHYPSTDDGVRDALRLAAGMTYKAAAAGVGLGGGKGVICVPAGGLESERRRAALLDFGDLVESLEGRYTAAEDVGIAPADIITIAERTRHVAGMPADRGGTGDPSPITARGVEAAIRACVGARPGKRSVGPGVAVVIGLGHVGSVLARLLKDAGWGLVVSDVDTGKRDLAARLGARWVEPGDAMLVDCDVLAPCALGGAIDFDNVTELRCRIVCGSANNQLADDSLAEILDGLGILYAPDFIANAGGLINVCREINGHGEEWAVARTLAIGSVLGWLITESERRATTPLASAYELARRRLDSSTYPRTTSTSPSLTD